MRGQRRANPASEHPARNPQANFFAKLMQRFSRAVRSGAKRNGARATRRLGTRPPENQARFTVTRQDLSGTGKNRGGVVPLPVPFPSHARLRGEIPCLPIRISDQSIHCRVGPAGEKLSSANTPTVLRIRRPFSGKSGLAVPGGPGQNIRPPCQKIRFTRQRTRDGRVRR